MQFTPSTMYMEASSQFRAGCQESAIQAIDRTLPRGSMQRFVVIKGSQLIGASFIVCLAYKIFKIMGEQLLLKVDPKIHEMIHKDGSHYFIEPALPFMIITITVLVLATIGICCNDSYKRWKSEEEKAIRQDSKV